MTLVTKGTNAKKKDVDVVQMYISLDGIEKLGQDELMQITDELIRRTELREFPILAAPHYNTEHTHIHLVVCAYNITGTKKMAIKEYRDLSWLGATIQREQFDQELANIRVIRDMQVVH